MKRTVTSLAIAALFAASLTQPAVQAKDEADAKPVTSQDESRIQLAILLDTSGSMQGLINQARTQIWKIVNELATARRGSRAPNLQVALYEYGKSTIPAEQGYIRQILPFTDNLDKISEELFALTTNGGEEFCGHVIQTATQQLQWDGADSTLKMVFIAGNEPFTQGSVDYKTACAAAIAKGITVNTIFCGPEAEGVNTGWRDGALLADGSFMSINQNGTVASINTPYDKQLAELSVQINTTFAFVGKDVERKDDVARQAAADKSAAGAAPAAAAERAQFKGSGLYRVGKDLVEGVSTGKIKLEELKDEELPENLRKKTLEEKQAYVKELTEQRGKLQAEIQKLSDQRKQFIAEQQRKLSESSPSNTFDAALIQTIRDQAGKKGYQFEKTP